MPNTKLLKESLQQAGFPADALDKVETLFQASLKEATDAGIAAAVGDIESRFEDRVEKAVAEAVDAEVEKVGEFMDNALKEWAQVNADKLDGHLKGKLVESFFTHLKEASAIAGVALGKGEALNESTSRLLKEAEDKAAAAEAEAKEAKEKLEEAEAELDAIKKGEVIAEETEKLSDVQADRVATLAEAFKAEPIDKFRSRVKTLVEAFGGEDKGDDEGDGKKKPEGPDAVDDGKGKGEGDGDGDGEGKKKPEGLNENTNMNAYLAALRGQPIKG